MLRERFGIYADATCPTGTALLPRGTDILKVCRSSSTTPTAPTCSAGTTLYRVLVEGGYSDPKFICVPSSTVTYPLLSSDPITFPCRTGDYVGTSQESDSITAYKCIPATTATSSSSSSSGSSSTSGLDTLTTQYSSLKSQYATLAEEVLADPSKMSQRLPTLQSLNQQIASVLDQMLRAMQYARQSPNSDAYRDELVATLTRIQTDYNGLKTNTDALETLRRIRGAQDESWRGPLFVYLMAFLAAAILLVLVIVLRRQKSESAMAPATSPSAIPPLT